MISSLYTSFAMIFFVFLSFKVIAARRKFKIGIGNAGNPVLKSAIRVHANFAEYVPLFLIGLYLLELSKPNPLILHCLAIAFFAGRILHYYGVSKKEVYINGLLQGASKFRVLAMQITFVCIVSLAFLNIVYFFANF
jgi:uncharacterized membrane protein YecN with MAPEG domain